MKFWEVLKELTEDPTKRFERKDRYKHWIIGTDVVDGEIICETYYFMLDCDGEDSFGDAGGFSGNIASNEDDWQLVRQPVTWQEAIKAWAEGKTVIVENTCDKRKYDGKKNFLKDEYGNPMGSWDITNGTWYIED